MPSHSFRNRPLWCGLVHERQQVAPSVCEKDSDLHENSYRCHQACKPLGEREKEAAMADCLEFTEMSVDRLADSIRSLEEHKSSADVHTPLSNSLTNSDLEFKESQSSFALFGVNSLPSSSRR
ncbi:uncharacterized protein LOC115757319 [Rhodamnia argentea]|uniref:Uncharacterized protein LOC115757319 n=1 Tax=Rhodamnia argentea TaxID=178133 RepID=A0ABM3H7B3_9MYRT|nr:uncharacterized protein LOC115757319 [Rhodamnia argentea]